MSEQPQSLEPPHPGPNLTYQVATQIIEHPDTRVAITINGDTNYQLEVKTPEHVFRLGYCEHRQKAASLDIEVIDPKTKKIDFHACESLAITGTPDEYWTMEATNDGPRFAEQPITSTTVAEYQLQLQKVLDFLINKEQTESNKREQAIIKLRDIIQTHAKETGYRAAA